MKRIISAVVAALSIGMLFMSFSGGPYPAIDGKALFFANCAACHAVNKNTTGPAFQEIRKDYAQEWIFAMIRDHDSVCASSDIRSRYLYTVWQRSRIFNKFQLTDEEVTAILNYVDTARPVAKELYRHRRMSDVELTAIMEFMQKVTIDTGVELYMHLVDSVQKI